MKCKDNMYSQTIQLNPKIKFSLNKLVENDEDGIHTMHG
jgi:hypothetical protein